MIHYLGLSQLKKLIKIVGCEMLMQGITNSIEEDFKRWETFKNQPRHASHFHHGVIELMVTHTDADYCFKYVNGHPENTPNKKLSVTGFGVLADVATGYPIFLSEMTVLTAFRTAASSVWPNTLPLFCNKMAIIGTGAQSEFHNPFKSVLGIETLNIFDIDPMAMKISKQPLVMNSIKLCTNIEEAIAGSDIITLCTTNRDREGLIKEHHLNLGQHYNAVGGDSPKKTEITMNALNQMEIFVELSKQTIIEGEIKQLDSHHHVTELWQVIQKKASGRTHDSQITLFDSVGYAIEDFSTLRYIYTQAKTQYIETMI